MTEPHSPDLTPEEADLKAAREFLLRRVRELRAEGAHAMAAVYEEKIEDILAGPQLSYHGPMH